MWKNKKDEFSNHINLAYNSPFFTVVCLIAKPLNKSVAKGDLVMTQILQLLFKCKLLCCYDH